MSLEIAANTLNRPSFGLEYAQSLPDQFHNLGPIVFTAYFEDTLRDWFNAAMSYINFHTNALSLQLIEDTGGGHGVLRVHMDSAAIPGRQSIEHLLGVICRLVGRVSRNPDIVPLSIGFQHNAPKDMSIHNQVFGCPIQFNADYNEIHFASAYLDAKPVGDLSLLKPLVKFYVQNRVNNQDFYDSTMRSTVALAIPTILGTKKCSLELIADMLEVSPKKLQRLLAGEDTNFSEVLDDVRQNMAKRLLAQSDVPIARIAGLLDYAGTPPFSLACKRWTGLSPMKYRKAVRAAL